MRDQVKFEPLRRLSLALTGFVICLGMAILPSPALSSDIRPNHSPNIRNADKPKIISLDYCADQYVLAMADADQIMALSMAAGSDYSFFKDRAAGLPKFHATVDEVLYLRPDVAVQSWQTHVRMPELTRRGGTRLFETYYGSDSDIIIKNITRAGQYFAQEARAEDFINDYQNRLEDLHALPKLNLRAAYITPAGYTAGSGTFVDKAIQLAGFQSYAAARKITGWQSLPMEDLLIDPPDILIVSFFDTSLKAQPGQKTPDQKISIQKTPGQKVSGQNMSGWSLSRHGLLYQMMDNIPSIVLPGRYVSCHGLFMVDAAERLRSELVKKGLIMQKQPNMPIKDQHAMPGRKIDE